MPGSCIEKSKLSLMSNEDASAATMEGNLYTLQNGDMKAENEFKTLAEAKTYVNKILGVTDSSTGK